MLWIWLSLEIGPFVKGELFPKWQILDSFKLGEFADNNFKFHEYARNFSNPEENTWKRRNCSLRAISPFPTVFSKDLYCRHVKTRACLGKSFNSLFLRVCCTSLFKTLWEKEKLLVTSNFSRTFSTVFSTHLESCLPFLLNLKLSSANSFSLEESKLCCLVMG